MFSLLLVPEDDLSSVEKLAIPVGIAVIGKASSAVRSSDGTAKWSLHEVAPRCIGAVAASPAGLAATRKFLTAVAEATDTAETPLCDLSKIEPDAREAAVLRFVVDELRSVSDRNLYRVADLSRSLAALRQTHEQMQASFAKLERFVFDNNLALRTETLSLLPGRDIAPLTLAEGETMILRLPISSVGLSDVALTIEDIDKPGEGTLSIALLTREDNALRALWQLNGGDIAKGLVRLSLHAALDATPLTPQIEVSWTGQALLRLASSLYHPDPRLQPVIEGTAYPQIPALRCWAYLPGCAAPLALGARLPSATSARPPRIRVIDSTVLAAAEDLTPQSKHSRYLADKTAVQVHPMAQGISVMRIAAAVPAGTIHVDARILTRSEQAPVIEYALAIVPSGRASPPIGELTADAASLTPWVALQPRENGELHLPLASALPQDHDLFLMTQLAVQPGDPSWGWATFDRIRVSIAVDP